MTTFFLDFQIGGTPPLFIDPVEMEKQAHSLSRDLLNRLVELANYEFRVRCLLERREREERGEVGRPRHCSRMRQVLARKGS